ncbi:MurR/RpiR family transcriptional regulator [Enterococcus plantarum]|uniref:MurR/RpiR family transcriptional regulator n=1 Tax=Enterococcus plantarum TaxID=1077675 RepID=UPI001A8C0E0C|nr:MurR/RpiR family transcriptional regulator [Enterococcus plantarum]MBO0422402.1 MurR/RpiR family transcriptional regulator [Enterococcus plantarum]
MDLETLMQKHQKQLSEMDWTILGYILENEQDLIHLSIIELGEKVHSSKSSILRLTKKLGFSGYSEFKYFMRQSKQHTIATTGTDLIALQTKDIENTVKLAQQTDFTLLSKAIQKANTVYCYATGYSQRKVIEEFSKMLMICDKRSIIIPVKTELDISMSMITKEDIVLFVSLSGETDDVKQNILSLNARKIPVVAITTFSHNFFAEHAQYAYFYYSTPFTVSGKEHIAQSLVGLSVLVDLIFRKYVTYLNKEFEEGM